MFFDIMIVVTDSAVRAACISKLLETAEMGELSGQHEREARTCSSNLITCPAALTYARGFWQSRRHPAASYLLQSICHLRRDPLGRLQGRCINGWLSLSLHGGGRRCSEQQQECAC